MSANEKPLAPGVTILVNDNGPGILDEELDEIFTRGFRSESTSSVEGSGIGLDISRSLISRMGGLIQVCDSNDDENKSLDGAAMKIVLFRNPKLP
jgi:signal transduction histidine kinase